ncbi:MAG: transposase [Anaerolineales bacterium]|nr:transposase [Anaerolineales bacterium]
MEAIKPARKRYFYGLKIHLVVTQRGTPVEFLLSPGAFSDTSALDQFDFDLPPQAWIIGDKAYNVYHIEDVMADCDRLLLPIRKANSKRPREPWMTYLLAHYRKQVETAGSRIERSCPNIFTLSRRWLRTPDHPLRPGFLHLLYLPPLGGNLGYLRHLMNRIKLQDCCQCDVAAKRFLIFYRCTGIN